MKLSDREKAAVIFGMVRAFEATRWPKHFNRDDKAQWRQRAKIASQMLTGGAFNPLDHWAVTLCADDELHGFVATPAR
jgi:hypothetical protein